MDRDVVVGEDSCAAPANAVRPAAVLFDFHDTLAELVGGTDRVVADTVGVPVDELRAAWRAVDARHLTPLRQRGEWPGDTDTMWLRLYRMLFSVLGRDEPVEPVTERLIDVFRSPRSYRAYPDARPALEALRRAGLPIGLVSNSDFDLEPVLEHVGLGGLVDVAVPTFVHGVEKPDPKAFEIALDALDADADRCWFVGDHPEFDAVAADVLGMRAVLVDREGRHAGSEWPFPRIPDLGPLPAMLGI